VIFGHLQHVNVSYENKFNTDTEVKEVATTALRKMSDNSLLHVFEEWVGALQKKCVACEGCYFEK
jgi:hypothetical protein